MPPKAKISRQMIVEAAFEIVRESGADAVNVRAISQKLNCSTQPVMYHFGRIEEIKKAVYQQADEYHSAYITNIEGNDPMLEIGLAYIRFAAREPQLFRFLFQSDSFSGKSITDLLDTEELAPVLGILAQAIQANRKQTKEVFRILFLFVHGYASMLANNSIFYDEKSVAADLERVFNGAVNTIQEEQP